MNILAHPYFSFVCMENHGKRIFEVRWTSNLSSLFCVQHNDFRLRPKKKELDGGSSKANCDTSKSVSAKSLMKNCFFGALYTKEVSKTLHRYSLKMRRQFLENKIVYKKERPKIDTLWNVNSENFDILGF